MSDSGGYDMLAALRDLAQTLPTRTPTTLRVGPGVTELLRLAASPSRTPLNLPLGVRIVPDDTYAAGEWRLFDQWDEELHSGLLDMFRDMAGVNVITSPYLPPDVTAVVFAPTSLHPDDPDYVPVERRTVVIREGDSGLP